jgi:hypothetical protein
MCGEGDQAGPDVEEANEEYGEIGKLRLCLSTPLLVEEQA